MAGASAAAYASGVRARSLQLAGAALGIGAAAAVYWWTHAPAAPPAALIDGSLPKGTAEPLPAYDPDAGAAKAAAPPPRPTPEPTAKPPPRATKPPPKLAEPTDPDERALAEAKRRVAASKAASPEWWAATCDELEALEQLGRADQVAQLLEKLRTANPELGGPDHARRLQDLGRRVGLADRK